MDTIFVYGTLLHPQLRTIVAGQETVGRPAVLDGVDVYATADHDQPRLHPVPGGQAEGLVITGQALFQRFEYYASAFGYISQAVQVRCGDETLSAQAFVPKTQSSAPTIPFDFATWTGKWAALSCYAAQEAMGLIGKISSEQLVFSMQMMRSRAHSRVLAEQEAPRATLPGRPSARPEVVVERQPYTHYFAVREDDVRVPRFDGQMGPAVNRAAFIAADAVLVLPYDPRRDRVLFVEQFRFGPYFRGDRDCFLIEPVAGRIDAGETPEQAARREAQEEAGLELDDLVLISRNYPGPGNLTEYLYYFVAITDLPDGITGIGGLESEAEDIRSHLFDWATVAEWLDNDRFRAGPTILLANWLARHRDRLRREAGVAA